MKHFNATISEDANRIFNPKGENISPEILPYITPTMEVKRFADIVKYNSHTTTGTKTIWTTPSDKDFYLETLFYSHSKNAACDVATGNLYVDVVLFDLTTSTTQILNIPVITLTEESFRQQLIFPSPIRLARNTAIRMIGAFTAGILVRNATITGYTVETIKN